jgi:hypothetical protein
MRVSGPQRRGKNKGNVTDSPLPATLRPTLSERLRRNDIYCCQDWRRLSRKGKLAIWGLTAAMVREVDAAIAEVMR